MSDIANAVLTNIDSLKVLDRRWVIRGRVLRKQVVYNKPNGSKFFHFDLYDGTARIRVLVFNDNYDRFYDVIEKNNVYRLGNANVRPVKDFLPDTTGHGCEIEVDSYTVVKLCNEQESAEVPLYKYEFVPFAQIGEMELNSCIATVGFVKSIGPVEYANGSVLRKIILVDQEGNEIILNVWGTHTEKFNYCNDSFGSEDTLIVAVDLASVKEYRDTRYLSTVLCSHLIVDDNTPLDENTHDNIMDTVRNWREWFNDGGKERLMDILVSQKLLEGEYDSHDYLFKLIEELF